jgi:hypothetical protein
MAKLAADARQLAGDGKVGEAHAKLYELFGSQWPEKGTSADNRGAPAVISSGAVDHRGSRFG